LASPLQAFPHPPQFFGSLVVSTQTVPQLVLAPQSIVHAPERHVLPAPQLTPQPPQLFGSAVVSTQRPMQAVKPWLHAMPHWPALHVAAALGAAGQWCPHAPQFWGSEPSARHAAPHCV
jgi:hypothetical protein